MFLQGRTGRQEDNWSRLLAKLEATYCVRAALAILLPNPASYMLIPSAAGCSHRLLQLASRGRVSPVAFSSHSFTMLPRSRTQPFAWPSCPQLGAASEDEGDAEREEEGSESGASDDEADEEGGKGASDGGEGGKEGGEGGSGKEGGEGKKKGPKNDYDYMDDWIDDEGGAREEGGAGDVVVSIL